MNIWVKIMVSGAGVYLLSGCGSILYDERQAPISDRTSQYASNKQVIPQVEGRQPMLQAQQQQAQRAQQAVRPYHGRSDAAYEQAHRGDTAAPGQVGTIDQYPAEVYSPYRQAGRQPYAGQMQADRQGGAVSQQGSPYGTSAQGALQDDGWHTPASENAPISAYGTSSAPIQPDVAPMETAQSHFTPHPDEQRMENMQQVYQADAVLRPAEGGAASTAATAATTGQVTEQPAEAAKQSVLLEAENKLKMNDLDGAVASLEKALRMDSGNPKILFDIANIRYHQGRYRDAETFASRAVSQSKDATITRKSWELIANARRALGNQVGAQQAMNNVREL